MNTSDAAGLASLQPVKDVQEKCYRDLVSNYSASSRATMFESAAPTMGNDTVIAVDGSDVKRSIDQLQFYTYGIVIPAVCALGIFGNVLNLAVLTRPHMKSVSHIYMRGEP
jgi:hypothetical protein